jgi:hypothetical protein
MIRQFPKFIAVAAALLFVAGCQTHDRVVYRNPVPWKTHPVAAPSDLPVDASAPATTPAAAGTVPAPLQ